MRTLYDSDCMFIGLDEENHWIYHLWKEQSKYMDDKTYKTELQYLVDIVSKFKPIKYLLNLTSFSFTVTPELQDWTSKNVIGVNFAAGVRYSAIIVSKDFFTHVSVEQTIEDFGKKELDNRYFTTEEEAINWLLDI